MCRAPWKSLFAEQLWSSAANREELRKGPVELDIDSSIGATEIMLVKGDGSAVLGLCKHLGELGQNAEGSCGGSGMKGKRIPYGQAPNGNESFIAPTQGRP